MKLISENECGCLKKKKNVMKGLHMVEGTAQTEEVKWSEGRMRCQYLSIERNILG